MQNIIPDISQVATATGVPVIDVYNPLVNHSEYFLDGVHPDVNGSLTVATVVHDALVSQGIV